MSLATGDIAEQVRAARDARTPLRIVGGGSWMDAGAPCAAAVQLVAGALTGVVEYEPGDLTLTARAGTTLADIGRITAAHGQWLPLEAMGSAAATLGATIATASSGPLAAAFGTPRDQLLGCEIVSGTGEVIRAGGRVVKNVAGFDLTRLMVGAWGTLGVITEATVRLRARPEVDATVAIALGGADDIAHAWRWLRASEYTPLAAELLSPSAAAAVGIGWARAPVLLLRAGGNEALVRALLRSAAMLGEGAPQNATVWGRLATLDVDHGATFRLSAAPSRIAPLWSAAMPLMDDAGGLVHASLARGVVRCIVPCDGSRESVGTLRGIVRMVNAPTCLPERLPAALWAAPAADAVTASLGRGVRLAFDPDHLLNPGIMGSFDRGGA